MDKDQADENAYGLTCTSRRSTQPVKSAPEKSRLRQRKAWSISAKESLQITSCTPPSPSVLPSTTTCRVALLGACLLFTVVFLELHAADHEQASLQNYLPGGLSVEHLSAGDLGSGS
ncbi:hypothetical protein EDD18DRAFT_1110653 [Armillaria luteobubalina]|uniref:Uncharacterized protein n=1 Tax=Armillaria luteobubalina TaxID=153913 RepID=A0AA39ULL7_9AGAR|nr:hypothetical protein EDD18DRAFT_1110653 [Armillaria luteobubalina]